MTVHRTAHAHGPSPGMADITFTLSPAGNILMITERWKSAGRPQQAEIILCGPDLERLRAVLAQTAPSAVRTETGPATTPRSNAANWPAIAAYLLGED
jgi:hypothetical protein